MSDIDKRLDSLVHWILHEPAYTPAQMKDKIKQLMADEFEKLIGKDVKTEIQPGEALLTDKTGYVKVEDVNELNILKQNQLRKELRQKLEEWKKLKAT